MRIETLLKILEFYSQLTFRVMDHYAGKYKNSIFHTLVELHKWSFYGCTPRKLRQKWQSCKKKWLQEVAPDVCNIIPEAYENIFVQQ